MVTQNKTGGETTPPSQTPVPLPAGYIPMSNTFGS
jgi:hypothetical protein